MPATKQRFRWQSAVWVTLALLAGGTLEALAGPHALLESAMSGWRLAHNTGDRVWLDLDHLTPAPRPSPPAVDDLLDHLRAGFELEPIMNERVQAELNWFVRNPNYLERVFNRAQPFLPYVVDALTSRDLPLELALLPIVESAYDPFAYSHGRAAGLWQMIPGTARRFGVRQNWWYDGRRDVVDATAGALNYLAYLNEMMDGDWMLAVAAYNSGEGNVLKAQRRNRSKSLPTDFWNLRLSRETSSYVPKLLALVAIVRQPQEFGLSLPEMTQQAQFAVVDTGGQLDLALAAQLADIDLDTLHMYNAGFNRWATDPSGPHRLIVPIEQSAAFETALAALPADERVRWKRHKVSSGETLSEIAERYQTTAATIRSANGFSGNTIRAGRHLMIPMASRPLSEYSQSADARRARTQNRTRNGNRHEHIVKAGESFWSIGQRYGVTSRQLASWNGMAPRDTLTIGQKLVVWTSVVQSGRAQTSINTTRKLRYTVRRGDSLSLIASRFRISINDIARWNNLDKNNILRPGQKLNLYVDVTSQSS